jgi:hypothetical protein
VENSQYMEIKQHTLKLPNLSKKTLQEENFKFPNTNENKLQHIKVRDVVKAVLRGKFHMHTSFKKKYYKSTNYIL